MKTALAFVSVVAACSSTSTATSPSLLQRSATAQQAHQAQQPMLARVVMAALPAQPAAPPPAPKVELPWHPQELSGGLELELPWQVRGVDPSSLDVLIAGGDSYAGDHDGASIQMSSLPAGYVSTDDEILGAFADNALSKQRKKLGARAVEATETQRTVLGHHAMDVDIRATGYDGAPTRVHELVFSTGRDLVAIALTTPAAASYADDAWKRLVDSLKVDDTDRGDRSDRGYSRTGYGRTGAQPPTDVFGSYRY